MVWVGIVGQVAASEGCVHCAQHDDIMRDNLGTWARIVVQVGGVRLAACLMSALGAFWHCVFCGTASC